MSKLGSSLARSSVVLMVVCLLVFPAISSRVADSLTANFINLRVLHMLAHSSQQYYPDDWSKCDASTGASIMSQDVRNFMISISQQRQWEIHRVSMGGVAQLNCSSAFELFQISDTRLHRDTDIFWYGYVLERRGNHKQALQTWKSLPVGEYFIYLAGLALQEPSFGKVDRFTRLATEIEPTNWELHLKRGGMLWDRRPDQATRALQRAIELAPGRIEGYVALGLLKKRQQKYCEAIQFCKAAIQIEQGNLEAWQCLGESAFHAEKWQLAKEAFNAKLELSPNNPTALFWLGRTYAQTGDDNKAIMALEQSLRVFHDRDPMTAFVWFELGLIFKAQGRHKKATSAFHRVIELDPDFLYMGRVRSELSRSEGVENRRPSAGP